MKKLLLFTPFLSLLACKQTKQESTLEKFKKVNESIIKENERIDKENKAILDSLQRKLHAQDSVKW